MNREALINLIRMAKDTVDEALPDLGSSFLKEQLTLWALVRLEHDQAVESPEKPETLCPHILNLHYDKYGDFIGDCKVKKTRCYIEILAVGLYSKCSAYEFARRQEILELEALLERGSPPELPPKAE